MTLLLIDTATFIWIIENNPKLSPLATDLLFAADANRYLSHVSLIEMAIKWRRGKLTLPAPPHEIVEAECARRGIDLLPLDIPAVTLLETLPEHHADPFDRLLICQALSRGMTFLTPDTFLSKYKVEMVW